MPSCACALVLTGAVPFTCHLETMQSHTDTPSSRTTKGLFMCALVAPAIRRCHHPRIRRRWWAYPHAWRRLSLLLCWFSEDLIRRTSRHFQICYLKCVTRWRPLYERYLQELLRKRVSPEGCTQYPMGRVQSKRPSFFLCSACDAGTGQL